MCPFIEIVLQKKYFYFPINYHSSGLLCEGVLLLFWVAESNFVTQVLSESEQLLWEWKMSQHFDSHSSFSPGSPEQALQLAGVQSRQ